MGALWEVNKLYMCNIFDNVDTAAFAIWAIMRDKNINASIKSSR